MIDNISEVLDLFNIHNVKNIQEITDGNVNDTYKVECLNKT
jgi:hypothetical protein